MTLSYKDRENRIKLDILESLSRSQSALADLIGSVARQTGEAPETARNFRRRAEVLVRYQQALAEKLMGIRINRLVNGKPGRVWLAERVFRKTREPYTIEKRPNL